MTGSPPEVRSKVTEVCHQLFCEAYVFFELILINVLILYCCFNFFGVLCIVKLRILNSVKLLQNIVQYLPNENYRVLGYSDQQKNSLLSSKLFIYFNLLKSKLTDVYWWIWKKNRQVPTTVKINLFYLSLKLYFVLNQKKIKKLVFVLKQTRNNMDIYH